MLMEGRILRFVVLKFGGLERARYMLIYSNVFDCSFQHLQLKLVVFCICFFLLAANFFSWGRLVNSILNGLHSCCINVAYSLARIVIVKKLQIFFLKKRQIRSIGLNVTIL